MEENRTENTRISRPLALFATGFMTASAVLCCFWEEAALGLYFSALAFAIAAFFLRRRVRFAPYAALVLAGAAAGCALWIVFSGYVRAPVLEYDGRGGEWEGWVEDAPQVYEDYTSLVLRVDRRNGASVRPFRIRLYLDGDHGSLLPGDRLKAGFAPELPPSGGQFDTARYLRARGIYLRAFAEEAQLLASDSMPLRARLRRMAIGIGEQLDSLMPARESGMLRALLYGDDSGLSASAVRALRTAGLSHITAVSGMNVAFLVGIILALLRRRYGTIPAIAAVVLFVVMTGAPASVVRAGIMQTVYLVSFLIRREPDPRTSLFFSALVILVFNPFSIADPGFLLSFFSTFGIIYLQGPIQARMTARLRTENRFLSRFVRGVCAVVSTTLSAQLFILPVQLVFFGELSLIAPVSNLAVLWASQFAFTFGAAACAAGFVFHPAGVVLAFVPRLLCSYILEIVPLLARIPYASITAGNVYLYVFLAAAALLCLAVRLSGRIDRGFAVLCASLVFALACVFSIAERERSYTICVASTGSGQSAALIAGQGSVVFNCGGNGYGVYTLTQHLSQLGAVRADVLILSSYRRADCAGAVHFLSAFPQVRVLLPEPADEAQQAFFEEVRTAAEAGGGSAETVGEDLRVTISGLSLDIYVNRSDDADDGRLMLCAQAGNTRLLAPGTLQAENLGRLLAENGIRSAEVLALGSDYSDGGVPGALRMLRTDYALASGYAEPSDEAVRALSETGGQVVSVKRYGRFALTVAR